ncbi:MAG: HAD-IC family P-type ATPase [Oscillospiraceae bacterium]
MNLREKLQIFANKASGGSGSTAEAENYVDAEDQSVPFSKLVTTNTSRLYPSLGEGSAKPNLLKIIRLAIAVVLLVLIATMELPKTAEIIVLVIGMLIIGYDLALLAINDIFSGVLVGEKLLVLIAAILLCCIGRGVEALVALTLFQFSYLARSYALSRTRKAICDDFGVNYEDGTSDEISEILKAGYREQSETEKALNLKLRLVTPIVLLLGLVVLIISLTALKLDISESLRRTITIIAIASPCGSLLAIPLTYFSGMGAALRRGIVFKSSSVIEKTAGVKAVVFDKSGVLTDGNYLITGIFTDKMDSATFLKVAAYSVAKSNSPGARAIVAAYGEAISDELVSDYTNYADKGVSVSVDGIQILFGSCQFITENNVELPGNGYENNAAYMAVNGIYAGRIVFGDSVRATVPEAIIKLPPVGIDRIAMVSGDSRERDSVVANELGIKEYYAECSQEKKSQQLCEIKKHIDMRSKLAFVCGSFEAEAAFNDADVGISMNTAANTSLLEKADIAIMPDSIALVAKSIRIAKLTQRFIFAEVLLTLCVKLIIIALAAFGFAPLWFGLLLDMCASLGTVIGCFSLSQISGEKRLDE